ncbi:DNA methyltransferase [Amaricoccus solimangrovi]|uniref:DNA methyltransferase n=1 Tax=Amaricoccus solimangrovi TaxID=2589815 RepID=UPI001F34F801|nr:DNA methyltransferase [Amaricoccus solimangrovi]
MNTRKADRMAELAMHPTVKPVAMIADAIRDCSKRGGIILDPFGGSGSTLIAVHNPTKPPPTMATSARRSPTSSGCSSPCPAISSSHSDVIGRLPEVRCEKSRRRRRSRRIADGSEGDMDQNLPKMPRPSNPRGAVDTADDQVRVADVIDVDGDVGEEIATSGAREIRRSRR